MTLAGYQIHDTDRQVTVSRSSQVRVGRTRRARATSRATRPTRGSPPGRLVSPVWTAEGWTMVLLGDDEPVEPLGLVRRRGGPRRRRRHTGAGRASRCARMRSTSAPGAICSSSGSSRSMRAARNRCGRHSSTMPALSRSPRSTSGTTRRIAYWKSVPRPLERQASVRAAARSRPALRGPERAMAGVPASAAVEERPGRLEAPGAGSRTKRSRGTLSQSSGTCARMAPRGRPGRASGASRRPRRIEGPGIRQQHVVRGLRERPTGMRVRFAPRVLHVQRGAVVDEPQAALPGEQVGIAGRPVDVGDERVEPARARPRSRRRAARSRRAGRGAHAAGTGDRH